MKDNKTKTKMKKLTRKQILLIGGGALALAAGVAVAVAVPLSLKAKSNADKKADENSFATKNEALNALNAMSITTSDEAALYAQEWSKYLTKWESATYTKSQIETAVARYVKAFANNVSSVPDRAFAGMPSAPLVLPDGFRLPSATQIGYKAFYYASLPKGFALADDIKVTKARSLFEGTKFTGHFIVPASWSGLAENTFKNAIFTNGLDFNNLSIFEFGAFDGATLNEGFVITDKINNAWINGHFIGATMPSGCKWVDKDGKVLSGPASGAIVKKLDVDQFLANTTFEDQVTSLANAASSAIALGAHAASELGIADSSVMPQYLLDNGVTISYSVKDNATEGELVVEASLKSPSLTTTRTFKITGFKLAVSKVDARGALDAMPITSAPEASSYASAWNKYLVGYEGYTHAKADEITTMYRNAFVNGVSAIPDQAFYRIGAPLLIPESFRFPEGVAKFYSFSFKNTILHENFAIPSTVTNLVNLSGSFYQAEFLGDFHFPDQITIIPRNLFFSSTFDKGFLIPSSVTAIDWLSFANAKINGPFAIPDTVTTLDPDAFLNVELPEGYSWVDKNNKVLDKPAIGASVKLTPKP